MQKPHHSPKSSEDGWYVRMRKATSFPQTGSPIKARIIHCLFRGWVGWVFIKGSEDSRRSVSADLSSNKSASAVPLRIWGLESFCMKPGLYLENKYYNFYNI